MSYRSRLGEVEKFWYTKFKDLTYEEASNIEDDLAYPHFHTEIFNLGEGVDSSNYIVQPFYNFDLYDYEECEFYIFPKESLKIIIKEFHKDTCNYFTSLCNNELSIERYLENKKNIWNSSLKPYYLDETDTDGPIVRSWKYEYAIFNLVHIYRFFDFENKYLIYNGW